MYKIYSIFERCHLEFDEWKYYQDCLNDEMQRAHQLHFLDFKNHESITLLPSYHPYWRFAVYLNTKYKFVSTVRTLRTYQNMMNDPILDIKTKGKVFGAIMYNESCKRYYYEKYTEACKRLIANDSN